MKAIFGGSFNPIHVGHVLTVSYLLTQGYDQVIVVPCYSHPYGKELASFEIRTEMCTKSLAFSKEGRVLISTVEQKLPKPSFTSQTVQALQKEFSSSDCWNLVLGTDLEKDFDTWEGADIIKELAPPLFIGRAGYEGSGPVIVPEVSSSEIRNLIKNNNDNLRLQQLLPKVVLDIIKRENLYK